MGAAGSQQQQDAFESSTFGQADMPGGKEPEAFTPASAKFYQDFDAFNKDQANAQATWQSYADLVTTQTKGQSTVLGGASTDQTPYETIMAAAGSKSNPGVANTQPITAPLSAGGMGSVQPVGDPNTLTVLQKAAQKRGMGVS